MGHRLIAHAIIVGGDEMPKCPGCGATVAEEGDVCDHCLSTALAAVLDAEEG
jgi:predicted amidophosphoribosyltransferase